MWGLRDERRLPSGKAGNFEKIEIKEGLYIMKKHRFWAWAMIACLFMTLYTGYKHQ